MVEKGQKMSQMEGDKRNMMTILCGILMYMDPGTRKKTLMGKLAKFKY